MRHLKIFGAAVVAVAALSAFAAPASATTLTSPEGTTYTGSIKAESEGAISLQGSFTTVTCNTVGLEGTVSEHGATSTIKIPLSWLTWISCNFIVKILKRGTLEWHSLGNGNATVTWSGLEMTVETSIANCIFTTNNTHIGTFTGGIPPRFHFGPSALPRTGHSIFCGSSGELTGTFKFPTPSFLSVD